MKIRSFLHSSFSKIATRLSLILVFLSLLNACGFVRYMNTKENTDKDEQAISDYLEKLNFDTYQYSLKMRTGFIDSLAKEKHVIDFYKLAHGTPQSSMQIRVYDSLGDFITGYTQCYGNLNWINPLRKETFLTFKNIPNNEALKYQDEFSLFDISEATEQEILNASRDKNRIVIYWNIWSNYYSKIMLKKTEKYIRKFDPTMSKTIVIIVNDDFEQYTSPQIKDTIKEESTYSYQEQMKQSYLNPEIASYYKEVFQQGNLVSMEDAQMLSIPQKLSSEDNEDSLFYFVVFTKSMNGADGFYAEVVGNTAYEFITRKSASFSEYFNHVSALNAEDFNNWATYIYSEIQIENEGQEEEALKQLAIHLRKSIATNKDSDKAVIENLIKLLEAYNKP